MHFKLQFPNPVIYFILMFKVNNNNFFKRNYFLFFKDPIDKDLHS